MSTHPPPAGAAWPRPLRRVGVFRALMLGDLLCATPALRALAAAWPGAQITLIGLPWAEPLARRLASVHRFEPFPGHPGLPERVPDLRAWPGFVARMRRRRFDLLVQLHGSGGIVNALLDGLGAAGTAGFVETAAQVDATHAAWPREGHEIERLLGLVDWLKIGRQGVALDFPLGDEDRAALQRQVPEWSPDAAYACVHPGAQLPSRRWPPQHFAAVADWLQAQGLRVVLTGTAAERPLTQAVQAGMRSPALDLAGRTSLFTLGALVERARLVVCNDTGVSHVAAALRVPSLVVSAGSDVGRWAPLDRRLHQVLWRDLACRPCAHVVCPYGHECATGVAPAEAVERLRAWPGLSAAAAAPARRAAAGEAAPRPPAW